jgi:hypothetical protein
MIRRSLLSTVLAGSVLACQPPPPVAPTEAATPDSAATPEAPAPGSDTAAEPTDQGDLPDAEAMLEAAVEAVGGRDAIAAIKTYYKEERSDIPAQNMSATSKYWWSQGNYYAEVEMIGVGLMKVWKSAEGSWADDPLNGLRQLDGDEAEQHERSASLVLAADWKKYYDEAQTVGRRKLGERTVVDVKLVGKTGDDLVLSIDETEGLVVQQQFTQKTAMGDMPISVTVEEWKDFDGYKEATVTVTDMKVMTVKTTVTRFEPNADVSAIRFSPESKKPPKGKR